MWPGLLSLSALASLFFCPFQRRFVEESSQRQIGNCTGVSKDWVAVKELKLSYHNGYIEYIIGFPQYSNLI